jgi:3-hydroxyisobutyrate dehydrogenase-like beta-hydroxyacid dehydrogenase
MTTIGMVSPGAMGSAIGRGYAEAGSRVVATLEGRSERTRELAHGLELLESLDEVVHVSDIVISVVPPGQALAVAAWIHEAATMTGANPLVADFNAVSPTTMHRIEETLDGLSLVDGSISGGPPDKPGTRLYLSGEHAERIAELGHPRLDVHILHGGIGMASAVKMSTASVYKGLSAIMLQAVRSAEVNGVLDPVLEDLTKAFPEMMADLAPWLASSVSKAGRYVAEMKEIAETQGAAGLTPKLFQAMATVWAHAAKTPLGQTAPEQAQEFVHLRQVLEQLS